MRCRHCGATIVSGCEYCSRCGMAVSRWRRSGYIRCRCCGKRVSAQGRLCPACGADLRRSWRGLALAVVLLGMLAAGYYVLTRVVTMRGIERQIARLPCLSLAAFLPQPTATFTIAPTQPATSVPEPTRIPTATPYLSPTPTRAPTATASPSPWPTARPITATPSMPYAKVEPVAPATGSDFAGADAAIILSWKPVGQLAEDEWYALSLRYSASGQTVYSGAWLKETSWRVPGELFQKPDPANPAFEWDVRIMKKTGSRSDGGSEGTPLSPASEVRTFAWR